MREVGGELKSTWVQEEGSTQSGN